MTITIDNAFIEQYRQNVIHLAQQQESKLRGTVMQESTNAEFYNWERLDKTEAMVKSAGADPDQVYRRIDNDDVPTNDPNADPSGSFYIDDTWDRRVSTPTTFVHLMSVEHEDKVQMLADPESEYAKSQAMAMNRSYDNLIIAAATGPALDGDHAEIAFPASQVVGDGTTPISFDAITEIQEIFLSNEIDMTVPKYAIVGPTQVRKLLQLTEQTSGDYVQREALQRLTATGIVPNWMGFTWIVSNLLLAPDTGEISCLFYTQKALGLTINQDVFTRIGENPQKLYMIQVFAQYTAGSVRVVDEEIVHGHFLDSL